MSWSRCLVKKIIHLFKILYQFHKRNDLEIEFLHSITVIFSIVNQRCELESHDFDMSQTRVINLMIVDLTDSKNTPLRLKHQ